MALKASTTDIDGDNSDRDHRLGCRMINIVDRGGDEMANERELSDLGYSFERIAQIVDDEIGEDHKPSVPKVRFGKTGEMVSRLTLGGMRQQQRWGPSIQKMDQVEDDCQENFKNIMRWAWKIGINHFETARGYGCSELQFGAALTELFEAKEIDRSKLLLQTKVGAKASAADFRSELEKSFSLLCVDYIDFFSVHGINRDHHLDWMFGEGREGGNCWDVVEGYVKEGKIRHVGFSSHGTADLIERTIKTEKFAYANLHYHYFGSYTASGDGPLGGNLSNIQLCNEHDMGVFIISPYDKGGALYKPSRKLVSLCKPELEPTHFGSLWLWHHDKHPHTNNSQVHTIVCGAARPSDLDDGAMASFTLDDESTIKAVRKVDERLQKAYDDALGKTWSEEWFKGVPNCYQTKTGTNFTLAVWCYNLLEAFGMLDFVRNRYTVGINNRKKWDVDKSYEENMKTGDWGYMPGNSVELSEEYVGERNLARSEQRKTANTP